MCHGAPSSAFPEPGPCETLQGPIEAFVYGEANATRSIAIIPDIYGCNPFYRGFATHLARKDVRVYLVNPFAGLGELEEVTREKAFERRHGVRDKAFLDQFEVFLQEHGIGAVVGFCLGGLYVMELARRGNPATLIGLYPFPAGLQNQDPLPVPLDTLEDVQTPQTILVGDQDAGAGIDNVKTMADIATRNAALDLHVYEGSGHGFLTDLDSDDAHLKRNAQDAVAVVEQRLF